jgi:hypothetical protein
VAFYDLLPSQVTPAIKSAYVKAVRQLLPGALRAIRKGPSLVWYRACWAVIVRQRKFQSATAAFIHW